MSCKRVLILLIAAVLTACQPLPQPFQDQHRGPDDPLLKPGPSSGLVVTPVRGVGAAGQPLADAVADALRDLEIPASSRSASKISYVLSGTVMPGQPAVIRWTVVDYRGVETFTLDQPLVPGLLDRPDGARRLAQQAAVLLEPRLGDPFARPHAPPKVVILPVEGAPGDGDSSLPRALALVLRQTRSATVVDNDPAAFLVQGVVKMAKGDIPNTQVVSIDWTVKKPDGTTVGTVGQKNTIPAGSLDGPWGTVAPAAAGGAAEGLGRVFETLGPAIQ